MRLALTAAVISMPALVASACTSDLADTDQALVVQSNACRVEYTVSSEWGSGFGANVTVTNRGGGVSSWQLQWDYANGQRITSLWNGSFSQSAGAVTVRDAGWNGALGTNASVAFGFNGTLAGSNGSPRNFRLNGVSCEGGGSGAGGGSGTGGGACSVPQWQQGKNYAAGDIVSYQGQNYIAKHPNPGYSPVISTWYWAPYSEGCGNGGSGGGGSGGGSSAFEQVVSKAQFEAMFPQRNPFYTYEGLVEAAKRFPAFAGTGDLTIRRREAAAFLANASHETLELIYIEEIAKGPYCDSSPWFCPCEPGKRYFGRGPIQLSWNYNYCAASQSIFGDREVLRRDPDRVARESWLAWATALWFWMTQQGAGTMTAHTAITQSHGFGETIRTINGGLECNGQNPGSVQSRIGYFLSITNRLGVAPGNNLGC